MAFTLEELKSKLKQLDEMTLLEVLNITSEELVEYLEDRIEERFESLEEQLTDEEEYNSGD